MLRSFLAAVALLASVSGAFGASVNLPDRTIVRAMVVHAAQAQGLPVPKHNPAIIVHSDAVDRLKANKSLFAWVRATSRDGQIFLRNGRNWSKMTRFSQFILAHEIAHYVARANGKHCNEVCANTVARKWANGRR